MTYITLIQSHRNSYSTLCRNIIQSQLGWVRVEGLSIWLKLTRWQQNILPATTQLRRMCLTVYLREVVMYCGATWKTEWWHLPPWNTTNHVSFCACLSRVYALTHVGLSIRARIPSIHLDACLPTLTCIPSKGHAGPLWRDTHSQSEESPFSHPMILKMLIVFHCLKHNKQTQKRDPANKQSQSVFSAANATHWEKCDWDTCHRFAAWIWMKDDDCLCVKLFCVPFLPFLPVDLCVDYCMFSRHTKHIYICVCVYVLSRSVNAATGDVI